EVRITAVEATPAEPEQSSSGNGQHDVARRVVLPILEHPRTDHGSSNERGHGSCNVDDVATAVVDGAEGAEPSTAPETEGSNRVHQGDAERDEERPRLEADAPEQRTAQDDHRDRREHELEIDER